MLKKLDLNIIFFPCNSLLSLFHFKFLEKIIFCNKLKIVHFYAIGNVLKRYVEQKVFLIWSEVQMLKVESIS